MQWLNGFTGGRARGSLVLDVAIVMFVAVLAEWNVWAADPLWGTSIDGPNWLLAALPLLIALPLFWRRRHPLLVYALLSAGMVAQALASGHSAEGLELVVAWLVGAYSVAAYSPLPRALAGLALSAAAYAIYAARDDNPDPGQGWSIAFWGLIIAAAWLVGVFVHSRRESAELSVQAAALEREAQEAVERERLRIARELHDIIAHSVSVIGLQAGAAELVLDREPERVRAPLQSIQASARDTVVELRRLLGILRDGEQPAALTPQPQLADLAALLEQVRASGLPVDLRVEGVAGPLPPGIELSAYRVVQEALTNVRKHAGAAEAHVVLRYCDRSLEVEISDDGAGPTGNGNGHGLHGMHERVALYGGTLTAGSTATGGFTVLAQLPHESPAA